MANTTPFPLNFRNPQVSANAGNSFWTVTGLTAWDAGHWEFIKAVQGNIFATVRVPDVIGAVPNARIFLSLAANATTGVAVVQIGSALVRNNDATRTWNPASLTNETAVSWTAPGTAYTRLDQSFTLTNQPAAGDEIIVEILHNGTNGSDNLAVNLLLMDAWMLIDLA